MNLQSFKGHSKFSCPTVLKWFAFHSQEYSISSSDQTSRIRHMKDFTLHETVQQAWLSIMSMLFLLVYFH